LEELSIKGAGISSSIKERYYSHLLFAFEWQIMFHIGTVVLTEMFLYWTRKFISLERGILEQNFQFCG
jgi:hypothetical protein